jgi:hypothetical protein
MPSLPNADEGIARRDRQYRLIGYLPEAKPGESLYGGVTAKFISIEFMRRRKI